MRKRNDSRILVVDNCKDTTDVLALLIRLWGYATEVCYDGPSVLEIALDCLPEVVLLDLALPGLDGLEVARRLRGQPELANLVLIAITGYGDESSRRRAIDEGFDHYLVKPVEPDELQDLLGQVTLEVAELASPKGANRLSGAFA
jgi:CheY-like chemotaxis protein